MIIARISPDIVKLAQGSPPEDAANAAGEADLWAQAISQRMLNGCERAYSDFYDAYSDRLFRYLLVLTRGDEQTSRDLLQQTMIKAIRHWKRFERERVLWCWLTQISKTSFIDHWRKAKRAGIEVELNLALDAAARAEDGEMTEALSAALTDLPAEDRELIESAYLDRTSHGSLASGLGTSAKAIESRLARIRQRLRKLVLEKLKTYALL